MQTEGARWRSGRASDSESRGPGFEPHKRHRVVSLSKAHLLPTVLVKPRKRWLRPDMTEKLLTGTLSLNTNKLCANRIASDGTPHSAASHKQNSPRWDAAFCGVTSGAILFAYVPQRGRQAYMS